MAILSLSKISVRPAFSNSVMATGAVMSLPSTMSSLASMSCPASTCVQPGVLGQDLKGGKKGRENWGGGVGTGGGGPPTPPGGGGGIFDRQPGSPPPWR